MTVDNPSALVHRPIPSLREWLGDGDRAESFEQWVSENLARQSDPQLTESERAFVRILNTISIAAIEVLRLEHAQGRDTIDSAVFVARAMGCASLCAIASQLREGGVPWLKIAKMFTAEFEVGAKDAARRLAKQGAQQC